MKYKVFKPLKVEYTLMFESWFVLYLHADITLVLILTASWRR